MRKVLKWIGIVIGALLGLIILAVIGLLIYGQVTFKRTVNRPVYEIAADSSPEGIARGEYLVRLINCGACHSPEGVEGPLTGFAEEFTEGPFSGVFTASNLTPDKETGLGDWTDAEIARATREGLGKGGVELIMPSAFYRDLSDADVAAMVGYLRSLEPVRSELPPLEFNAPAKAAVALGLFFPRNPQAAISAPVTAPAPGAPGYGEYLVTITVCRLCHGENLTGGSSGVNITTGGELADLSQEDFITLVRGRAAAMPPGRTGEEEMSWKAYGYMTDADLVAIFQYLQSVPAK